MGQATKDMSPAAQMAPCSSDPLSLALGLPQPGCPHSLAHPAIQPVRTFVTWRERPHQKISLWLALCWCEPSSLAYSQHPVSLFSSGGHTM